MLQFSIVLPKIHCLCGLHFNTIILGTVCGMNFIKATAIWYTWAFLLQRKRKSLREIAMNCINKVRHRLWKGKSLRETRNEEYGENEELGENEGLESGELGETEELGENEEPDVPMVTVGDAIQSFLLQPDDNTKGMCLTKQDDCLQYSFLRCCKLWSRDCWPTPGLQEWKGEVTMRRFKLASPMQWWLIIFV